MVRSHVHKSSWYMRGLNAYDKQGCNGFIGCVPECKFYAEEEEITEGPRCSFLYCAVSSSE